ncbi:hypothetical protein IMSAGC016_01694 [Muribaculaceae bacterium]|nr:hypothetical protein IMSAGC016_01694 [Muribaculaceae bacterium]
MTPLTEGMQRFNGHAVKMGKRKHVYDSVAGMKIIDIVKTIPDIAPERTVRKHHSLRHSCGSARIIYYRELFRLIFLIFHGIACEIIRKLLAEAFVYVVAGFRKFLASRQRHAELAYKNCGDKIRHTAVIEILPYGGIYKKELCSTVVHEMHDGIRLELMQNGHGNDSGGQTRKKHYNPVGGVLAAYCHPVAFLHARRLEHDVQLDDSFRNILILVIDATHVGKRHAVPVFLYRLFNQKIQRLSLVFHNIYK